MTKVTEIKCALVGGWGAVERKAAEWHDAAELDETEPRLWIVRADGAPIGVIGKEPWSREEIQRRADALGAGSNETP